jgi:hypothetical protein
VDDSSHGRHDAADRNGVDLTNVLCFAAVIGFTITAWAVYRQYVVGHGRAGVRRRRAGRRRPVRRRAGGQLDVGSGNLGVQINRWMEVLGSAVVIALVLVPAVDDWVTRRP